MQNKNILFISGNSEIAQEALKLLLEADFNIYLTSRSEFEFKHKNLKKYKLDVTSTNSFDNLKEELKDIQFHSIVNFAGVAISSPVENLPDEELQKQLDINLFGLLKIIRYFSGQLIDNGKLINISSMASYGIFPFISPYCASKSAADVLLRAFSIENNIKCVSIRPGAIKTVFWDKSIELNKENFKNFGEKYKKAGEFLIENAKKNSKNALSPKAVGKVIFKTILAKNPKATINVGLDSKIASFASKYIDDNILNSIIKFVLKTRMEKQK